MNTLAIEGFCVGLSTGVFCLGSCLPVLLPFILVENRRDALRNFLVVAEFSGGRLVAYLAVGITVGYLGRKIPPGSSHAIASVLMMILSLLLIAYGMVRSFPQFKLCSMLNQLSGGFKRLPFMTGLVMGINVCPPFLLAITRILDTGGGAFSGALFFSCFFAGTSVFIAPLIFLGPFGRFPLLAGLGRASVLMSGCVFFTIGFKRLLLL